MAFYTQRALYFKKSKVICVVMFLLTIETLDIKVFEVAKHGT